MKTIEQLMAEQAKELASLERKHRIVEQIEDVYGIKPNMVFDFKPVVHLIFKMKTLGEAVAFFTQCPIYSIWTVTAGSTFVQPLHLLPDHMQDFEQGRPKAGRDSHGPFSCFINAEQGGGYGPNGKLMFWMHAPNSECMKVQIQFGTGYIDTCAGVSAKVSARHHPNGTVVERTYGPNPELKAGSDYMISWWKNKEGAVETSCHYDYFFKANGNTMQYGSDQEHAVAKLLALAETLGI
jgi:hypothetical protein